MSTSRKNLVISTFKEFIAERSFLHGAALAYYAIFALVPILYLSIDIFGRVVGHETMVSIIEDFLTVQIGLSDVTGILEFLGQLDLGGGKYFHGSYWDDCTDVFLNGLDQFFASEHERFL